MQFEKLAGYWNSKHDKSVGVDLVEVNFKVFRQ